MNRSMMTTPASDTVPQISAVKTRIIAVVTCAHRDRRDLPAHRDRSGREGLQGLKGFRASEDLWVRKAPKVSPVQLGLRGLSVNLVLLGLKVPVA